MVPNLYYKYLLILLSRTMSACLLVEQGISCWCIEQFKDSSSLESSCYVDEFKAAEAKIAVESLKCEEKFPTGWCLSCNEEIFGGIFTCNCSLQVSID